MRDRRTASARLVSKMRSLTPGLLYRVTATASLHILMCRKHAFLLPSFFLFFFLHIATVAPEWGWWIHALEGERAPCQTSEGHWTDRSPAFIYFNLISHLITAFEMSPCCIPSKILTAYLLYWQYEDAAVATILKYKYTSLLSVWSNQPPQRMFGMKQRLFSVCTMETWRTWWAG